MIDNEIEMFDLLVYNRICHGIDVIADDITSKPVGLEEGRTATDERVSYTNACKVICLEVDVM